MEDPITPIPDHLDTSRYNAGPPPKIPVMMILAMVGLTIGLCAIVTLIRPPKSDNTVLYAAILGFGATITGFLVTNQKQTELRIVMDGRFTEVIEMTRQIAFAKGREAGVSSGESIIITAPVMPLTDAEKSAVLAARASAEELIKQQIVAATLAPPNND